MILASNSPRRKEILDMLGFDFKVRPSLCDENITESDPEKYCVELSRIKALDVSKNYPDELVIGADTIVVLEGEILGKPKDKEDALRMLKALSGKTHTVFTGVTLCKGDSVKSFFEKTLVMMYDNDDEIINKYLLTKDSFDKAGAYGIQGPGCVLIKGINGDYYNVMGLPAARLVREIMEGFV